MSGGRRAVGGIAGFNINNQNEVPRIIHSDPQANYCVMMMGDITCAVGYFPPNPVYDQKLLRFLNHAIELSMGGPLIITGDFNARSQALTGDHSNNSRGNLLLDWYMNQDAVQYVSPNIGLYTTCTILEEELLILFSHPK